MKRRFLNVLIGVALFIAPTLIVATLPIWVICYIVGGFNMFEYWHEMDEKLEQR